MSESTLEVGEPHPMAFDAQKYVGFYVATNPEVIEAIYSTALSGNRNAEICASTLRRLLNKEPVSDRYLLGLAWMLKQMEENKT